MLDEVKKQLSSANILITLLIIAVGVYLFQAAWQILGLFSDVLIILFSAWILSIVLDPLVQGVSQFTKIPRSISATIIYALFFGLLALTVMLFIPAVIIQIQNFSKTLPRYLATSPSFVGKLSIDGTTYLENSLPILPSVANFLFYVFLVVIISIYLVLDKERFIREFYNLLPKKWHEHAQFTQELIDNTFGSFIRLQLLFGLIAGIATWVILHLANIDFAASTALIAGILTTIPLIGPILGIIPPVAIALLTDPTRGLLVLLALVIFQQVLFNIVGPKLMGKAFKLHPIVVLLSFIVGYRIFGPLGAIFGAPVLAILIVVIHRLSRHFLAQGK